MLTRFAEHYINPKEVAYVSPTSQFVDQFAYRRGFRFAVTLKSGKVFSIEVDEFVETPEERKAFYKNYQQYHKKIEELRNDLVRQANL